MRYLLFLVIFLAACGDPNPSYSVISYPSGCSVTKITGGTQIVCGNTSSVIPDPNVTVVPLCPNIPSATGGEVLFNIGGNLYGVYSDPTYGASERQILVGLTYRTTDGRACYFSVNADGTVTQH